MMEYKRYTGVVEFDLEGAMFSGHVIDLRNQIYFEGRSVEELEASMRRAVDRCLAVCEARGEEPDRPFSGNLHLRLGPELPRAATTAAAGEGRGLNSWIVDAVDSALARTTWTVRERPSRRSRNGKGGASAEPHE